MAIDSKQVKVFLSHASEDKPLVRKLYFALKQEAWIDPWLDEEKLLPGQDWEYEIDRALNDSDAVIICLSNNSISKIGVVQAEIHKAESLQKKRPDGQIFMIPVLLEKCRVPDKLSLYQWADISEPGTMKRIVKSLENLKSNKGTRAIPYNMTNAYKNEDVEANLIEPQVLRKIMDFRYSLETLRVLCFDLGVRYEDLPSKTLTAKIVDLIEYCTQHNKYEQLIKEVSKSSE